jgi:hypothetical protein
VSPGRIALEDFGGPAACAPGEEPVSKSAPAAEAEVACIAPLPEPDPEARRNEHLARIANTLETMAVEQAALRARCLNDAADALGAAAASLVPALARAGFPALVAEAARSIAECGQLPELAVSLAPSDAEEIARYLITASGAGLGDRSAAHRAIRIDPRDDVSAGEADLRWDGGGAKIDVAAISDAVLTEYRRKLDLLAQSGA